MLFYVAFLVLLFQIWRYGIVEYGIILNVSFIPRKRMLGCHNVITTQIALVRCLISLLAKLFILVILKFNFRLIARLLINLML